jgi:hypothetical protein
MNSDRVALDGLLSRAPEDGSGGHVERRAVAWARNRSVLEVPFGKGALPVGAGVTERVHRSADVSYRDLHAADLEGLQVTVAQGTRRPNRQERAHVLLFPSLRMSSKWMAILGPLPAA